MQFGGSQRIKVSSSSLQILPSPGNNACMCTQMVMADSIRRCAFQDDELCSLFLKGLTQKEKLVSKQMQRLNSHC